MNVSLKLKDGVSEMNGGCLIVSALVDDSI